MASPTVNDLRTVEITVSTTRTKAYIYCRRAWYGPGNVKHPGKTRVIVATYPVPLDDTELLKLAQTMAGYCMDPNRRHQKPPSAVVWREAGTSEPVPPGGGEGGEDTPADMDPLPLPGGFPTEEDGSTITTGPAPLKAARPKAARSTARELRVRNLRSGKQEAVPGA